MLEYLQVPNDQFTPIILNVNSFIIPYNKFHLKQDDLDYNNDQTFKFEIMQGQNSLFETTIFMDKSDYFLKEIFPENYLNPDGTFNFQNGGLTIKIQNI